MAQKEIIDRDNYKKIKKMDRETLTKFILQYYNHFHPINDCTVRDAHEFTTNYYDWFGPISEILEKYLS